MLSNGSRERVRARRLDLRGHSKDDFALQSADASVRAIGGGVDELDVRDTGLPSLSQSSRLVEDDYIELSGFLEGFATAANEDAKLGRQT